MRPEYLSADRRFRLGKSRVARRAFSLLELLVVVGIIFVLLLLFFPVARYSREPARRTGCLNNLRQLGLALHDFHDANGVLPQAYGVQESDGFAPDELLKPIADQINGAVWLLPFVEQNHIFNSLIRVDENNARHFDAKLDDSNAEPWSEEIGVFGCPSSRSPDIWSRMDYGFSVGDVISGWDNPLNQRSPFGNAFRRNLDDIADGTSQTIAMVEMGGAQSMAREFAILERTTDESLTSLAAQMEDWKSYRRSAKLGSPGRGEHWGYGSPGPGLVNTVLQPGSRSFRWDNEVKGVFTASRTHPAGTNVLFLDGSVHFISATIDSGKSGAAPVACDATSESPFGVWGALGTFRSEDDIDEFGDW